ncbi:DUF262 domain-containing protein [Phosphitispora fastidiosa]|uniref:DUF262 domain-containing protein n=1 Tax=Phosphitispora fastidiosa TaxID=2837202 RepID=UPI001E2DBCF6|nr:DUF262 domain-containing protein [Phosphitispora fastidiosa]MBU7008450.1 hypothetical protein [Phosphitispora fastidiosa]
MNASETKLQPIIEGTKQYVVPLFQRSYSWDKKEWEILWNDLIELSEMENPRDHFIGSIVTMPTTSVPEGVAKYLLIDGQQRLSTIFILLTLLRDQLTKIQQNELAEEINNTLLVNPYKKESDHYKLLPTQVDRASFKKLIDSEPILPEDKVTEAYKYFERKVKQSNIDCQTLQKVISSYLSVVSIVLDPEDNPHLVFESLNAKGRPLTQSDLIRNYFFMRIHINDQENVYSDYWKPMQEGLGDNLTEFIRHYLMRTGSKVKQSDVYLSLKELVGQEDALNHLKNLSRFAEYYQKLLCPDNETNLGVRKALQRINRIEVTTAYPFLLNCYDDYAQTKISDDDFIEILKVIENFMIRRFVCNVPTNQLNKIFPPLYTSINNKETGSFVDKLKGILQSKGYPKDSEFKARLQDSNLYGTGDRARKTKIILESIEESYNHKEQVPFEELTIEHVMPQTLTEWWQDHLGDDWGIIHDLHLHTLGNLTLTAYNPELSNDDFENKRIRFTESHLELNKYFVDKLSWNKEDILSRANFLAEKALEVWPYFGDKNYEYNGHADVTGTTPQALWILGQKFSVNSWRDVLEQTTNTIAELEPDKFEQLIQQFPRFIGRDKKKFRAIRELKNGAFIEINLSAQVIQKFCFQAIEAIELTTDEWQVETIE